MKALDSTNEKFGKGKLRSGREGFTKEWVMRSDKKTPQYTTNWGDVICVN